MGDFAEALARRLGVNAAIGAGEPGLALQAGSGAVNSLQDELALFNAQRQAQEQQGMAGALGNLALMYMLTKQGENAQRSDTSRKDLNLAGQAAPGLNILQGYSPLLERLGGMNDAGRAASMGGQIPRALPSYGYRAPTTNEWGY